MAVLKEDLSVLGKRKDSFKASKFGSLRMRVSSSQPRRLDDSKRFEEVERSGCLVNIEKINNNLPSFKVGPCQLQRKTRETKSAQLSLSIRNLALSIRAARFNRKRENVSEGSPERESLPSSIEKDLENNNLRVDLNELAENHSSNDDGELSRSFCNENSFKESCQDQESKTKRSGKSKKKKRTKTARKIKVKRNISLKDVKKKHSPRLGKLKISNDEGQKSIIETLSLNRVSTIQDAYTKTRLSPRHNKSLPSLDHKLSLSPSKSQNSLCDPEDIAPPNWKIPARCIKVYLSEKHSGTVMGIPAVPPGTPGLEMQKEIDWVPSLSDIKSQRSITMKLSSIVAKQRKKEKQEKLAKEQRMKEDDKRKYREMQAKIKQRQRAEIYALNKILTEVENEQYERVKKERGLPV